MLAVTFTSGFLLNPLSRNARTFPSLPPPTTQAHPKSSHTSTSIKLQQSQTCLVLAVVAEAAPPGLHQLRLQRGPPWCPLSNPRVANQQAQQHTHQRPPSKLALQLNKVEAPVSSGRWLLQLRKCPTTFLHLNTSTSPEQAAPV